jgi:exosome complex component RRP41
MRSDGRGNEDLREIKIQIYDNKRADGSVYLQWGQNKVLASVFGPREVIPKHLADPYKAIINYTYRMATFSVPGRHSPKPKRRDIEISKISKETIPKQEDLPCLFLV